MGLDARLAMGQENFNNLRNQVVFVLVKMRNQTIIRQVFEVINSFVSFTQLAPQGFGMPRQSPLEEGEHAGGDTDDDVMMIDEVEGNKGRSLGRRDVGRGRRSRSRLVLETSS